MPLETSEKHILVLRTSVAQCQFCLAIKPEGDGQVDCRPSKFQGVRCLLQPPTEVESQAFERHNQRLLCTFSVKPGPPIPRHTSVRRILCSTALSYARDHTFVFDPWMSSLSPTKPHKQAKVDFGAVLQTANKSLQTLLAKRLSKVIAVRNV